MTDNTVWRARAIVTIVRASELTGSERKKVAKFLRSQADFLELQGDKMSRRYRARYMQRRPA